MMNRQRTGGNLPSTLLFLWLREFKRISNRSGTSDSNIIEAADEVKLCDDLSEVGSDTRTILE